MAMILLFQRCFLNWVPIETDSAQLCRLDLQLFIKQRKLLPCNHHPRFLQQWNAKRIIVFSQSCPFNLLLIRNPNNGSPNVVNLANSDMNSVGLDSIQRGIKVDRVNHSLVNLLRGHLLSSLINSSASKIVLKVKMIHRVMEFQSRDLVNSFIELSFKLKNLGFLIFQNLNKRLDLIF